MNKFVWHALGLIFGGAALVCGMLLILQQAALAEQFPDARDGYIYRPHPQPVPEPATLTLLGVGAAAAAIARRKRK